MTYRITGNLIFILAFFLFSDVFSEEVKQRGDFRISSHAFEHHGSIPAKYTCDGADINPSFTIENVPDNAESLVFIVDDPDAPMGVWVHWVLWNINPRTKEIKENTVPDGAHQGINDFGKRDYGGPCPPSGTHRYFFKLYALDTSLELRSDARKADVVKAMAGHIITDAQIIGLYKRK